MATRIGRLMLAPIVALALLSCSGDSFSTGQDGLASGPAGPEATPPASGPGSDGADGGDTGGSGDPPPAGNATSSVTVLLTDDPADVTSAWVDIRQVYLQGGDANGRLILFEGPTGYIELLALVDDVETLVESVDIPAGSFGQLRVVIEAAAVQFESGDVIVTKNSDLPEGVSEEDVTGELLCPSCTTSGFKVLLQGRDLSMLGSEEILVLDFDVEESFLRQAGNSGKWVMKPVIKLFDDPEDAE